MLSRPSLSDRVVVSSLLLSLLVIVTSTNPSRAADWPEVGAKAPDFELPVQGEDAYVKLSELVKEGPVVVVVLRGYPGYQCGICNRQVGALINRAKGLKEVTQGKDRRVLLVYPGPNESLDRRAAEFIGSKKLASPFLMVRDPDMEMVSAWGLRWKAPRETAYPSAFVIDGSQRIRWAKVSDSHAGRATPDEIIKSLRKL